ncbi:MAG TPA: ABC-2 family transporter protein [Gemmatimonadaceae bacterium]|nr:ABC-2 family transporter protein [Gemmatimonadaceae bacterium]
MERSTIRGTIRFAVALARTSLAGAMAQRGTFVMQAALMALNNAIFFTFWIVLLHRVHTVRGYDLHTMTVLYGTVAAGVGLAMILAGGVTQLARFIHEGELDAVLAQPKPTLLYVLGRRSGASGVGDLCTGLVMIAIAGTVRPATVAPIALAIVASAVVMVSAGVMFGSAAFWLGPVHAATRQLFELVITFSLYPEPLFGGALRVLLFTLVPSAFVGYVPARLVQSPTLGGAAALLIIAVVYATAATWVFGRGLRSYCGGSRFELVG